MKFRRLRRALAKKVNPKVRARRKYWSTFLFHKKAGFRTGSGLR